MIHNGGASRGFRYYPTAGPLIIGMTLITLSLLDWAAVPKLIPMPSHVAISLQAYIRFWGIILAAIGLLAPLIVRSRLAVHLEAWFSVKRHSQLLLTGIVVMYVLVYVAFTSYRHYVFNSAAYDLGIMDQAIWNTSQGRPFESSLASDNSGTPIFLGSHFQPLMGLVAPLYWIYPSVYWLLILQSICLGLGAIPLFHIARQELQSSLAGIALALAYCLYPPMGYVNRFDFHPEIMAILFILTAWYAISSKKLRLASLCLGLTLLTREELGLTVAMIGLVAAISGERRRFGLIWCVLGISYSLVALLAMIPAFRGGPSIGFARYSWLGSTPPQILGTIVSRPAFVLSGIQQLGWFYMLEQIFAPVALLPLASPLYLVLLVPTLAYNLLANYAPQHTAYYQYITAVVPTVFIAAVYGASNLIRWFPRFFARSFLARDRTDCRFFCLLILISLAAFSFWYNSPIRDHGVVSSAWTRLPNEEAVRRAINTIPPDARVITTNHYGSHLSHRRFLDVYYLRPDDLSGIQAADIVFLNLQDSRDATNEHYQKLLSASMTAGFGVVYHKEGVVVLQRNAGSRDEMDQLLGKQTKD